MSPGLGAGGGGGAIDVEAGLAVLVALIEPYTVVAVAVADTLSREQVEAMAWTALVAVGQMVVVDSVCSTSTLIIFFTLGCLVRLPYSVRNHTLRGCGSQVLGRTTHAVPDTFSANTPEKRSAQSWYHRKYGSLGDWSR